ncbi:MAG TPA: RsmE family RNA methyltransferase [Acidobacteriaceae bacterium]|nr:RsmE family RNA methyltransferase [Acidobacteriaceae bacterium]
MTRRRWIADEWTETTASLLGERAAHLSRVLRAQPGQQFDVVTAERVYRGTIVSVAESRVEFSLDQMIQAAASLPLTMVLGIVRFERFEWAIEKLTELGVARMIPLAAQRSEKHLVQAAAKRIERWRKIARESAQQSRRGDVPEISDAMRLPTLCSSLGELPNRSRLLLSEREDAAMLQSFRDEITTSGTSSGVERDETLYAAVGPEGGWTDAEINLFTEHGWQPVGLGPRILRTETAAIMFASVLGIWLSE